MNKIVHFFAPQIIGMKIYIFLVEKQRKFRPFFKIAVALPFMECYKDNNQYIACF